MNKHIRSNKSWGVNFAVLLLRVVFGATMLYGHGLSKWSKLFAGGEIKFLDPLGIGDVASLGLAVFAEVICSVLLIFGLVTRLALIPLMITMSIALFMIHGSDGFATQEKAILYLGVYVVLFVQGSGRYSLDNLLR